MKSEIYDLFIHTSGMRSTIIQNIDNQVLQIREVYLGILTLLGGATISLTKTTYILLGIVLSFVFWIIETYTKRNQRSYIFFSNLIQKKISYAKTIEEKDKILIEYAYDIDGYYSCKNSDDKEIKEKYKHDTSLLHTLFMKNVCLLYIAMIFIQLLALILVCFARH